MDHLDQEIADAFTEQPSLQGPGRILFVGGSTHMQTDLAAKLAQRHHHSDLVNGIEEGQAALARNEFDLVVLAPSLPDGSGLALARMLRQTAPATRTIVLTSGESFDQAVEALRCGVIDLVEVETPLDDLVDRIEAALVASRADTQRERRLNQLKVVCKKLVAAREEVSEHLDRLCKDLVAAYEDASEQMSEVAMAAEFRTLLRQELDVEDLLRTALEYLLTRTGPTNAAVFLPDATTNFELGAYVNYDCPRETITVLLNHLCRTVCPQMVEESQIVSFDDAKAFAEWAGADAGFLAGCEVIAFSCRHEGKCMAVMVLFRSKDEPFDESLSASINILQAIFAEQVANVIRVHHRASPSWPKDPLEDDEFEAGDYDDYGFGGLVA
jgi:DNA-binding response OmpR family regulator